jgi:hypothetical protein
METGNNKETPARLLLLVKYFMGDENIYKDIIKIYPEIEAFFTFLHKNHTWMENAPDLETIAKIWEDFARYSTGKAEYYNSLRHDEARAQKFKIKLFNKQFKVIDNE